MKLLIILSGIMRTFEHTWPHVALQLRLAELENRDDLQVDVLVLTQLDTRCTAKDFGIGTETDPIHGRGLCSQDWLDTSREDFLSRVRAVYGSRLRLIVDFCNNTYSDDELDITSRADGRNIAMVTAIDRRLEAFRRFLIGLLGSMSDSTRAFSGYNAILALRPDAVLVSTPSNAAPVAKIKAFPIKRGRRSRARTSVPPPFAPLDITALCQASPGSMRLISGSLDRYANYHARDIDHGFLICPPAELFDWLMSNATALDTCTNGWPACARGLPPPKPKHFTGAWVRRVCHLGVHCDRIILALRRNFTYDALPESVALAHLVRQQSGIAAGPGTLPALCTLWRARPDGRLVMPTLRDSTPGPSGGLDFKCHPYALPRILVPADFNSSGIYRPMPIGLRPKPQCGIPWLADRIRSIQMRPLTATASLSRRDVSDTCASYKTQHAQSMTPRGNIEKQAPLLII